MLCVLYLIISSASIPQVCIKKERQHFSGECVMPAAELATWMASGWCLPVPVQEVSALRNLMLSSVSAGALSGLSSSDTNMDSPNTRTSTPRIYGQRPGGAHSQYLCQTVPVSAARTIDTASPFTAALMQHALEPGVTLVALKIIATEFASTFVNPFTTEAMPSTIPGLGKTVPKWESPRAFFACER